MYPIFGGPPGPLTAHIDAPQLGLGMEKPFLTTKESDWKMTRTNWKYRGDRFRVKLLNELVPTKQMYEFQLQRQAFPTSYSAPCTYQYLSTTVQPSPDPTVEPQCSTCLRLLKEKNTCVTERNYFPNGKLVEVAVNNDSRCNGISSLELNKCGVQCGQPQNYETTSVSCWPKEVVAALSR